MTKLTVEEARSRYVCRVCGESINSAGPKDWPVLFRRMQYPIAVRLDFGKEFAHERCLLQATPEEEEVEDCLYAFPAHLAPTLIVISKSRPKRFKGPITSSGKIQTIITSSGEIQTMQQSMFRFAFGFVPEPNTIHRIDVTCTPAEVAEVS